MKIETHLEAFKEHKDTIFDWGMSVKGIEKSQRIVGLHASRGIIELFSAYLHEKEKISPGKQINHRWFKSEKVFDKIPEFPKKRTILRKIIELENLSEDLTYESPKPVEKIKHAMKMFTEIEEMINQLRK